MARTNGDDDPREDIDDGTGTDSRETYRNGDEAGGEQQSLAEKYAALKPDTPSTSDEGGTVAGLLDELTSALAKLTVAMLISVTKIIPGTTRFWRGLLNAGYRGLHSSSDADAIGHIAVGNEIKHVPLEYDYDKKRYENEHDDYWNVASEGDYEYRVAGRVPAVWGSAASNELGTHVQAEVAEVLDVGDEQYLYADPNIDVVLDAQQGQGGQGQARADGGMQVNWRDMGMFDDALVDLGGENRIVSMNKYYETYPSVVAPEEMQLQEWRGRQAEQNRDYGKLALKMMLIAAAAIAAATMGPPAVQALFGGGGGGGGGGSIIPAMIGLLGVI
jgi:hypothetical protein